ncbi:10560_t:CDS:2, partial [Gigaspora margarita]
SLYEKTIRKTKSENLMVYKDRSFLTEVSEAPEDYEAADVNEVDEATDFNIANEPIIATEDIESTDNPKH